MLTIASRNELLPRVSVYQLGRGREPMIVVGRILSAEALNIDLNVSLRDIRRRT
jgi:hypothetical protein